MAPYAVWFLMGTTPSTEAEPHADAQRGPSLAGYVGMAVGLFVAAVLLCVSGVFDQRVVPLWNPAIVAATSMGLVYAEPRPALWQFAFAGAVLGLAYAALVLGADALSGLEIHLSVVEVLLRALAIGVGPALVGGLLLRWLAPTARRDRV
jgi:hypothetical protein